MRLLPLKLLLPLPLLLLLLLLLLLMQKLLLFALFLPPLVRVGFLDPPCRQRGIVRLLVWW